MSTWVDELFQKAEQKISAEHSRIGSKIPYWTDQGLYQTDYAKKDIYWWCNGFWSGILWQLFHATKEEKYKITAQEIESKMDQALHGFVGLHHDVGFMWLHTAVADYRLTQNPQSKSRGLAAASALASRYNPTGQFLRAWNPECVAPDEDCTGWIIVDSMMNLPILYWASDVTNDPRFLQIAKNHADTVAKTLLREDGSCGHIACINPNTGDLEEILAGQGFSNTSAWSRGQSWILYGFALSYRHTRDLHYLNLAKQVAHYFIANITLNDYLPLCDFRQPEEPAYIDASAALCAVCGLLEIASQVDVCEKKLYQSHAKILLKKICATCCDWNPNTDSIVQKCKVAYHNDSRQQTDLIYADYFLVEALLRLKEEAFFIW